MGRRSARRVAALSGRPRAALLAAALLAGGPAAGAAQDWPRWPERAAPLDFPVHGSATVRYTLRESDREDRDQDLYEYLALNAGNAARHAVTATLFLRSAVDLEGDAAGPASASLSSLEDARGGPWDVRLYRAYLAFHRLVPGGEVRAGRQNLYETPVPLQLDGLAADAPAEVHGARADLSFYMGVPEHAWEPTRRGDAAGGLAAEFAGWTGSRARVDFQHVRDRSFFGANENNLLGARLHQVLLSGRLSASAAATALDGSPRDAGCDAFYNDPALDLQVSGRVYSLLRRQAVNTLEFDPFAAVLAEERAYVEGQLSLAKGWDWSPLGDKLRVEAGAQGRMLRGGAAPSEFNREYQRFWLGSTFEKFPWRASSVSLHGDWWDAGGDTIWSAGGEWAGTVAGIEAAIGTSYALYRFDFFALRERAGVRDYYVQLRRGSSGRARASVSLSFQEDGPEEFLVGSLQVEVPF